MPVPTNHLKAALRAGNLQTGIWLGLVSSYSAEMLGHIGFDWLLIDGEHAPNDLQTISSQLQALKTSSSSIVVRPPISETWMIKQLLDAGAQSLLIPMVENGADAERLVKAVRYPPRGVRGVGASLGRASEFGAIGDYMETADEQICLLLQVESRAALAALDDIASTDGVDCIFIGPSDLSADMGYPGNIFADEVRAAIEEAIIRIKAHGKAVGIYTASAEQARHYIGLGVTFVALGADVSLLRKAAVDLRDVYKPGEAVAGLGY
jgi:4-hydroxy-2-oxoheptanedioate aldolase